MKVLNEHVVLQLGILRRLISYLIPNDAGIVSVSPHLGLSDATYSIQRELVLASDAFKETLGLDRICCVAGLISIECFLRQVNPNANIVGIMNERIQTSISQFGGAGRVEPETRSSTLLLWACFVGAVTSKQIDWYLQQIALFVEALGLQNWVEVAQILEEIAFPDDFFPAAARVWEQVVQRWQQND